MSANIANTIWKQILAGGAVKVMCWGVPMNSRVGQDEKNGDGWLRFKVSGMKFKGIVKVLYHRVPDVYSIKFLKQTRKKNLVGGFDIDFKEVHEIENVYCDELTEKIDEYVEKIPAYKY